jgi:phosphopentomutase
MKHAQKTGVLLVIDAVGVSTLEYLLSKYPGKVRLPNLARLGLGELLPPAQAKRLGAKYAGKSYAASVKQVSATADSLVGHREMMGVVDHRTYDLFDNGFGREYLAELEKRIGRKTFFNKMAGGMEAIELNAKEHERTGKPIAYASKCDPLIQLAMNEAVIPVPEQHKIADIAFALAMEMKIPITRAIARSYIRNAQGEIIRTGNRHDAVLPIGQKTLVDVMNANSVWTVAVGKTSDLVNTTYRAKIKLNHEVYLDPALKLRFVHPKKKDTNPFTIQGTVNALQAAHTVYRPKGTFIFVNLVDTDSVYGHTRDVEGALRSLEEIDRTLPLIEKNLAKGDLLAITADHGMLHREDYGYHNNEPLPFIACRKGSDRKLGGLKTGTLPGLTDIGGLFAQFFGVEGEYRKLVKLP